jgi:hypothetical protein
MPMMKSQQIINDVKNNFKELNYSIIYQEDLPVKMIGIYETSPIFTINFSDGSIDFEDTFNNKSYKNYIKPTITDSEKFLVESSGVCFYYYMHRSLIQKLIPKIVLAIKNYYIKFRKETIENDFACRR